MPIVALISASRGLRRSLRKAFEGQSEFELLDANSIGGRTARDLKVLQQANVVLVDLEPDHHQSIADIRRLRDLDVCGEIVPISKSLDSTAMRALFALGTADWIQVSDGQLPTAREIFSACDKAVHKGLMAPQAAPNSHCRCYFAAAGGVGQTTLVAATGLLLAERRPLIRTTCLIDLDFQNSVMADYMGVEPLLDIDALGNAPERIDKTLMEIMVARYSNGLSILAAPRARWNARRDLSALVPRILNVASEMFDDIVIDLPAVSMPWTLDVLSGSDDIHIVTNFSVTGVRQAKEVVDSLPTVAPSAPTPNVIVNRSQSWTFGGGLRKQDVTDVLESAFAGFVPDRGKQIQDIINIGKPDELASSAVGFVKDLRKVIMEFDEA